MNFLDLRKEGRREERLRSLTKIFLGPNFGNFQENNIPDRDYSLHKKKVL